MKRLIRLPLCGPPVSLRLGHSSGLKVHRTFIQYLGAASLPHQGRLLYLIRRWIEMNATTHPSSTLWNPPSLSREGLYPCTRLDLQAVRGRRSLRHYNRLRVESVPFGMTDALPRVKEATRLFWGELCRFLKKILKNLVRFRYFFVYI